MPLGSSRIALVASLLCAALACLSAAPIRAGEAARSARLCPEDAPEGVRLPPKAGCGSQLPARPADAADGFRDIGGVKVRVGGRVGAEYGIR